MQLIRTEDRSFVPASHEDPGRPGVYKRVLRSRDEIPDGHVQMINWARLPVGSSFRAHYHEDMEESFIVIAGQCQMRVQGQAFDLTPGDTMVVSAGEVHAMQNTGSVDVHYIVVGVSMGNNGRTIVVDSSVE